jgi:RNA polymerase sigma-70 factor (ECF subfamily)
MADQNSAAIESELLRQVARGDQQAFGRLYDSLSGVLYSVVLNILGDPRLAEDVLQDAFVQIWEKAWQFDTRLGTPLSWALTLARNKAIDHLRASQRRRRLIEQLTEEQGPDPFFEASTDLQAAGRDEAAKLRRLVSDLPREQRQAIEMAFFAGLTQTEISATLNEPLGTIKARIRRGMLRLRESLDGE